MLGTAAYEYAAPQLETCTNVRRKSERNAVMGHTILVYSPVNNLFKIYDLK